MLEIYDLDLHIPKDGGVKVKNILLPHIWIPAIIR